MYISLEFIREHYWLSRGEGGLHLSLNNFSGESNMYISPQTVLNEKQYFEQEFINLDVS